MSTVQNLRPPPLFVGDHPALDFVNTLATPATVQIEWLANGTDLLDWLKRAGMIDETVAARFRAQSKELDAVAEQARELREWFRGYVKRRAGNGSRASAPRELEPLNRLLAEDEVHGQVVAASKNGARSAQPLRWSRQRRWTSPRRLLQPVAEAMGDLACNADFDLIRACEGANCTLLFYDRTKGHARRWCSMRVCGNRAKAAAYRARRRRAKRHKREARSARGGTQSAK